MADAPAGLVEPGQRIAGLRKGLATVVNHAPDIAEHDIVVGDDFGQADGGVKL